MRASYSRIQTYKACRRLYELKYVEGVIANSTSEALERGTSYHDKIESLFKTGEFTIDDPKTSAMALAFKKHIYPMLQPVAQEEWFSYETKLGDSIIGRIDALNQDGAIIEHKTTSGEIDEQYWYTRFLDEQLLTYMYAYGTTTAYYTVIRTPSIRQKKGESDEEFMERCLEWYEDDTEHKIAMREIFHTKEEIDNYIREQSAIVQEMKECTLFYRNQSYCTKWGRMCEYAPICEHYDPDKEYIGFTKGEKKDGN